MEGLKEALDTVAKRNRARYDPDPTLLPDDRAIVDALQATGTYKFLSLFYANTLARMPAVTHPKIISDAMTAGFLLGVVARGELEDRQLNELLEQQYGDPGARNEPGESTSEKREGDEKP